MTTTFGSTSSETPTASSGPSRTWVESSATPSTRAPVDPEWAPLIHLHAPYQGGQLRKGRSVLELEPETGEIRLLESDLRLRVVQDRRIPEAELHLVAQPPTEWEVWS